MALNYNQLFSQLLLNYYSEIRQAGELNGEHNNIIKPPDLLIHAAVRDLDPPGGDIAAERQPGPPVLRDTASGAARCL